MKRSGGKLLKDLLKGQGKKKKKYKTKEPKKRPELEVNCGDRRLLGGQRAPARPERSPGAESGERR